MHKADRVQDSLSFVNNLYTARIGGDSSSMLASCACQNQLIHSPIHNRLLPACSGSAYCSYSIDRGAMSFNRDESSNLESCLHFLSESPTRNQCS